MHLKQLKLAGFKSFLDPVVIPFPSHLAAVVGPNGCGKSNIIDAVRWVMGESSAKNLRGESMVDVIFNGSAQRKAVGQAFVELAFDNSLGRLSGQFSSYQEIVVKRSVSRDGESRYYLNNVRCRRRDITDIFLGTGAGARGYSIIGQGTISRLIEARPEELRAYFEEAAGVSKYKERRRETVSRMDNTRENLTRVADIREELGKQLDRLERQASTAKRYHALKAEQKQLRIEIIAIKQRNIHEDLEKLRITLQQHAVEYETYQAQTSKAMQHGEAVRNQVFEQNQAVEALQQRFYQLGTELARLEENQQQQQREKQRLQALIQRTQDEWQTSASQLQQNKDELGVCEADLAQITSHFEQLKIEYEQTKNECDQQEANINTKLSALNQAQLALQQAGNAKQVAELNLSHAQSQQQEAHIQIETLLSEQQQLEIENLENILAQLNTKEQHSLIQLNEVQASANTLRNEQQKLQDSLEKVQEELQTEQDNAYRLRSEHAAAQAKLQTLFEGTTAALEPDKPKLAQTLQLEPEWMAACELVLADSLQAVVVDDISSFLQQEMQDGLFLVTQRSKIPHTTKLPRLIDKIKGDYPDLPLDLSRVYAAKSIQQAIQWLPELHADESIVTREGHWLAQGWYKTKSKAMDEKSVLRQREDCQDLTIKLTSAQQYVDALLQKRDVLNQQFTDKKQQLQFAMELVAEQTDSLRALQTELQTKQHLVQQTRQNQSRLAQELARMQEKLEQAVEAEMRLQKTLQDATAEAQQQQAQLQYSEAQQTQWQTVLQEIKEKTTNLQNQCHQQELQKQRQQLMLQQLQQAVDKGNTHLSSLQDHLQDIKMQLQSLSCPDTDSKRQLQEKVQHHQVVETQLNAAREKLTTFNDSLQALEKEIKTAETQAKSVQEKTADLRVKEQELLSREAALIDTLQEYGVSLQQLSDYPLPEIPLANQEARVLELVNQINRLGAVNLAAIDEYQSEYERKQQLDNQYQDLNTALQMLEDAIEKIDKETRLRLQETFDAVNESFQQLFPRLFGGGCARLQLTCDNLLEAGILVMAQPPGKRNSTIHLLSGGEKAMTAVALVFAIFQLNPSPFCMLDEVDAPLDDVNVGRFCALVKEMSQYVQFLFITHNKLTMELADHLIGVTMREPGVSRVVAVDVEQALSMTKRQMEE